MEDVPELWGFRIRFVSKQTSPICSYLPLTHVVAISTQRVLLPHFPLTQSELSLHNLQAWTPSSVRLGGFTICYILVVLENGDWCWNQNWKGACLPVGDGKRHRRAVRSKMEVMVSLSLSSKYYQLIHIKRPHCCKFLLNEYQLPCLSFPSSLIYFLLMPQSLFPSQSCLSHVPVMPGHGSTASTRSAQFPSWLTSLPLPVTVWHSTSPGKLWMHHTHIATVTGTLGRARAVCPWAAGCLMPPAPAKEPPWLALAFLWCSVTVLGSSCPTAQSEPASAGCVLP